MHKATVSVSSFALFQPFCHHKSPAIDTVMSPKASSRQSSPCCCCCCCCFSRLERCHSTQLCCLPCCPWTCCVCCCLFTSHEFASPERLLASAVRTCSTLNLRRLASRRANQPPSDAAALPATSQPDLLIYLCIYSSINFSYLATHQRNRLCPKA